MYPRLLALLLIAGSLAAAATGASAPSEPAIVSAGAHGLSILVPGQPASVAAEATAPGPAATGVADGFVFPADGSLVRTGALSSSVVFARDRHRRRAGVGDVLGVTLFNGEVTAESVGRSREGDRGGRRRDRLQARRTSSSSGRQVAATPNLRVQLGRLGLSDRARAGGRGARRRRDEAMPAARSTRSTSSSPPTTAACPPGTEILVGHAEAAVSSRSTRPPPRSRRRRPRRSPVGPAGVPGKKRKPLPKPPEPGVHPNQPGLGLPDAADGRLGAALARRATSSPSTAASSFIDTFGAARGRRRLASRPGHLRAARGAAPRRRRRDDLLGRLERPRRLPALAARPAGQPVLLRPPLGVLAARRGRQRGEGRRRGRLRRQHRRRADDAVPPPLRDPPGRAAAARLRRGRQPDAVPDAPGGGSRTSPSRRAAAGRRRCPRTRPRRGRRRSCSARPTSPAPAASTRARWTAR